MRGTYQGLTATVLKQGTNQAIRFYVMNLLRNWYKGEKSRFTKVKLLFCSVYDLIVCVFKATTQEKKCIQL